MLRLVIIGVSILCSGLLMGQTKKTNSDTVLSNPIQKKIYVAGNFGEPRSDHFHSGIDIKTEGVSGLPVYAVMDGYISRIKVDPGGYGHALYLTHPDGRVSLYGHLSRYIDRIDSWVKSQQYRKESFSVDLYPPSSLFRFKQGDQIAWSGNTGSSMGPHLHFEMRDAQTGNPINVFEELPDLDDITPPVLRSIFSYSQDGRTDHIKPITRTLIRSGSEYIIAGNPIIPLDKISGLGIEAYDLVTGSSNKCGIYKLRLFLNDQLIFESALDEIGYSETRYVNSYMDYEQFQLHQHPVIRMFIQPNNRATIYSFTRNRGLIQPEADQVYRLKIEAEDVSGNRSVVNFQGTYAPQDFRERRDILPVYNTYFNFSENNSYSEDGIHIELPRGSLYDNLYFQYSREEGGEKTFSAIHHIHFASVPLQRPMIISIQYQGIPPGKEKKALIVKKGDHGPISIGGEISGNQITANTSTFGDYYVMLDTVPPTVTPINFVSRGDIYKLKTLKFRVNDNLAGIHSFRGEIDGHYALFEYDPKKSLLEYTFDPLRVKEGEGHSLRLRITDSRQNAYEYTISFDK